MHIVIVGNGVAGVTSARTIREMDPKAKITIYTEENHLYYPRPRLYEVLSGEAKPQEIYMYSKQWYEKRSIQVNLNRKVLSIVTSNKKLILEDHSEIDYDRLLLANGAHPQVPPVKGSEQKNVFTLRSLQDALTIKEYSKGIGKVIILGGGLLGLEFAASLRKLSMKVEIVELFPRLLPRQLDQDGASLLKERIEYLGINIRLGLRTEEILASGILLENGNKLPGELILISAGIVPNTNLAAEAGIEVSKGVIVNQHMQTSAEDVYAAGDVTEFEGRVYGIIPAALEQATIAAQKMIGREGPVYKATTPSNTLKIMGLDLTSMGIIAPEGSQYEEIKKLDRENGIYKKIVIEEGKIVGAIILGNKKGVTSIKTLMDQKKNISKYKDFLLQDDFDFQSILA